jgi:hypothetical protein
MSERDWDAELRKIDEQMARVPAAPPPSAAPSRPPSGAPSSASAGATPARAAASLPAPAAGTSGFGVYARLTLATALAVGIIFWPYAARCGLGLAGYLGAVGAVIVAGAWSAVWTWKHRAARAHTLSLLLVLWGLLLAAMDVLPRVGYAIPTAAHPATWSCS